MKPTYIRAQKELYREVHEWFSGPSGHRLIQLEQPVLGAMTEGLFGYYLVQIQGVGYALELFNKSPIAHRFRLDLNYNPGEAGKQIRPAAYAHSEMLPLATASVDAVILPHTLDFALDPHRVLKEVERILIPEGRVIVLGFNPVSLWGLLRLILQHRGKPPWSGHFLSYQRVSDWLGVLGFDIELSDVCAFVPPMPTDAWAGRIAWMENWGKTTVPGLGGVYALRAVKRVSTIRPIKMRNRRLRTFGPRPAAANVTIRKL